MITCHEVTTDTRWFELDYFTYAADKRQWNNHLRQLMGFENAVRIAQKSIEEGLCDGVQITWDAHIWIVEERVEVPKARLLTTLDCICDTPSKDLLIEGVQQILRTLRNDILNCA